MRKLLIYCLCGTSLALSGCSSGEKRPGDDSSWLDRWSPVYKPEIQQGNIINQEMVDKLRPGMDKRQVRYVLGTPLLVDVFHQNRWDYFYSLKPTDGPDTERRMSLYFRDNSLVRFTGDLRPQPGGELDKTREVVISVPDYEPRDKGIITLLLEKLRFGADW